MEKTTTTTYGKVVNTGTKSEKGWKSHPIMAKKYIKESVLYLLAFCCGRAFLFQMINPLGIAYLTTSFLEGYSFYLMLVLTGIGFATSGIKLGLPKYFMCLFFCGVFHFILGSKIKKLSIVQKSILGGIMTLLSGVVYAMVCGMSQYLVFVAAIEGTMVFTLAFVFDRGIQVLKGSMKRRIMTSEEMISLSIVIGSAVAGISGVSILGVPVEIVLTTFLVLIAGYRGGAGIGTTAGVLFGFLLMAAGRASISLFCILSIAGLLCGALNSMGKGISCISFLMGGAIVAFYIDNSFFQQEVVIAALIGSFLFILLPKKIFAFINTYACYEKEFREDEYFIRMKEMVQDRLKSFARGFSALSKTFSGISERKTALDQKDVSRLIDDVAAKVCDGCGLKTYCWEEEFYNTYQTIFGVLSACEKRGKVQRNDIPEKFGNSCVRMDYFIEMTNRTFELYKNDLVWENKLRESRELVSQQLGAVAEIISQITTEIDFQAVFHESLEKELRGKLDKAKWDVSKTTVAENQNGSYEVVIDLKSGYGKNLSELSELTGEVLGRRMKRSSVTADGNGCIVKLEEESRLHISTGVACVAKDHSTVSGDSYSFLELKDGEYLMALSDGMGSGKKANKESVTTIELLEQFIECGFEKELAIKIINSVLVLKSGSEIFSTLDICSMNRYTGIAEFIKIGAASAYILRNGEVRAIRSYSLPVGIMKNIDLDKTKIVLKPNDILIMMTDGVGDLIEKETKGEEWIQDIFCDFQSYNPQDVADYVLIQAKKRLQEEIRDDMTVLAARIWEK